MCVGDSLRLKMYDDRGIDDTFPPRLDAVDVCASNRGAPVLDASRPMQIHDTIESLRRWISEAPGRGAILEEDQGPPDQVQRQGWLSEAVPRRWARAEPGVAIHPDDQAHLPVSFIELIQRFGSMHWVPPEDYDGELATRNAGPEAFLALAWPGAFDIGDFLQSMDPELVARLEAAGVDQFTVFHDNLGDSAAFDGRFRGSDGQPLVVEGLDEESWISHILEPNLALPHRSFDEWLHDRISRVMVELADADV